MKIVTEKIILDLIKKDKSMMDIIVAVASIDLEDWVICSSFVRNKVWDYLHSNKIATKPNDIDVVFFDKNIRSSKKYELQLSKLFPGIKWEMENQAFAHTENMDKQYKNTLDAISKWPDTTMCIGVTVEKGELKIIAPYGLKDLNECLIKPTPKFAKDNVRKQILADRISQKKLFLKWPRLKVSI